MSDDRKRLTVRMDINLHELVVQYAKRDSVTVNQWIVEALRTSVIDAAIEPKPKRRVK